MTIFSIAIWQIIRGYQTTNHQYYSWEWSLNIHWIRHLTSRVYAFRSEKICETPHPPPVPHVLRRPCSPWLSSSTANGSTLWRSGRNSTRWVSGPGSHVVRYRGPNRPRKTGRTSEAKKKLTIGVVLSIRAQLGENHREDGSRISTILWICVPTCSPWNLFLRIS